MRVHRCSFAFISVVCHSLAPLSWGSVEKTFYALQQCRQDLYQSRNAAWTQEFVERIQEGSTSLKDVLRNIPIAQVTPSYLEGENGYHIPRFQSQRIRAPFGDYYSINFLAENRGVLVTASLLNRNALSHVARAIQERVECLSNRWKRMQLKGLKLSATRDVLEFSLDDAFKQLEVYTEKFLIASVHPAVKINSDYFIYIDLEFFYLLNWVERQME